MKRNIKIMSVVLLGALILLVAWLSISYMLTSDRIVLKGDKTDEYISNVEKSGYDVLPYFFDFYATPKVLPFDPENNDVVAKQLGNKSVNFKQDHNRACTGRRIAISKLSNQE